MSIYIATKSVVACSFVWMKSQPSVQRSLWREKVVEFTWLLRVWIGLVLRYAFGGSLRGKLAGIVALADKREWHPTWGGDKTVIS